MMIKPEITKLINDCDSVYSLVIAVAKRSRDLAAEAEEGRVRLYDKPVNVAIDEFSSHKLKVVDRLYK
ncbi:MAG: DNA-directed RNA polymerase subunit omega [Oscillospiraceae bacterium]|nr:DNA-directed RNA polymerase subunit omega [Oscillospiraceae bacterium]